jgi:hypothetical protein
MQVASRAATPHRRKLRSRIDRQVAIAKERIARKPKRIECANEQDAKIFGFRTSSDGDGSCHRRRVADQPPISLGDLGDLGDC